MLLKQLKEIYMGKRKLKRICRKNKLSDDVGILLFPHTDKKLNYAGLKYLDDLIAKKYFEGVYIITCDEWTANEALKFSDKIKGISLLSFEDIMRMVAYYSLVYTEKIIVVSLVYPNGRYSERLLLNENVTIDDLVCIDLYSLYNVPKKEFNDNEI